MRTPATDSGPADWVGERLLPLWSAADGGQPVGAIVPTGFAAYARVFHDPTWGSKRIRWSDVAASTGRTAHPLMEWHRITKPAPDSDRPEWDREQGEPIEGEPSDADLQALVVALREFTKTPEQCWYCSWVGWAGSNETGAVVRHPSRDYFLSSGSIDEAAGFGEFPPNIWWPEDRAWCVASEIDLMATYVGGSEACIERLLTSDALEALAVAPDDRVDAKADAVNRD